jgi:hypothetical protein
MFDYIICPFEEKEADKVVKSKNCNTNISTTPYILEK